MPGVATIGAMADYNNTTPIDHNPQLRAAIDGIKVGGFVWRTTNPSGSEIERQSQAWATNTGTGKPAAFVYLNRTLSIPHNAGSTLSYTLGANLAAAVKGAFYALATGTAAVGQKVFATLADGAIQTGAAGATISGAVETDFEVKSVVAQNMADGTSANLMIIANV